MSFLLIFAAATTVTSTSCTRTVVVNGVQMPYEDAAKHVLEEGRKAKEANDNVTAKVRFKEVLDHFEDSDRVPDALAELGDVLFAEGGCAAARLYLEELASNHPLHPRAGAAKETLAKCEGKVAGDRTEGPLATFKTKFDQAGNDAEKKDVASAAADAAIAAGDFASAVRWLLRVQKLEEGEAQKKAVREEITDLIDSRVSFQDVRELLEEVSGTDFPKAVLTYKLARIQYHVRDLENARETLKEYLATWPGGPSEAGAKELLALLDARANVKPRVIGVLLPLSGKNRAYGESALQAIQLAIEGEDPKKNAGGVTMVVRDTKSDRVAAAQAVEELALQEGAIAIVGPVFTNEARPAAYKAQELGIPLMTISSADELGTIGPYVFRNGLTNKAQAEALVHYAMEIAGMTSFAILYRRDGYGEDLMQLFWDEVEKRNGEIRGVESYGTEDTTFASQVKALVARDVLSLRTDFKKAVEECDKQPDNYRKERCKDKAKADLKPLIDFDGLFIPDYPRNIALVSAALAFEDIIVETDPRYLKKIEKTLGRTVKPVTLLGASGWNSTEVPEKAQRNVENAVFTDAFFAGSDDKQTVELVNTFRRKLNRTPTIVEALVYDSARIIKQVIESDKPETRDAMREALRRVAKYPGVTGKTSFVQSTDAQKEVRILTIKNGQIQEVPMPEKSAEAATPTGTQ